MSGIPIIISAPSGAGKTSLVDALLKRMPRLALSISHTTRKQRPGEVEGINYHFISETEFNTRIHQQLFLEYAEVFGNYYGTAKKWVMEQLTLGLDVIFEIDWQGARRVREQFTDALSIFILPPSHEVLSQRLCQRGQDDAAVITKRLQEARNEMSHYQEFDYLVVNDTFETAINDLEAIIRSRRLSMARQKESLKGLLEELLVKT